jgi:taurine dioxygenase
MTAALTIPHQDAGALTLRPLAGCFGAEVGAIDLAEPLSPDQVTAVGDALYAYRVLVFRDQHDVAPRALERFARCFGAPETDPHPQHGDHPDTPAVKVLHTNSNRIDAPVVESWHTDGATREDTRYLSILQAIDVPPYGRDTMFADMVTAYDRLSTPMKAIVEDLVGINSWGNQKPGAPPVEHPIVFRDRQTGRKSLYANKIYTIGIKGMRPDESQAMLDFLLAQSRIPEFQLRVSWAPGTIVMWDNETTQHYLVLDKVYDRVMHRVMVN